MINVFSGSETVLTGPYSWQTHQIASKCNSRATNSGRRLNEKTGSCAVIQNGARIDQVIALYLCVNIVS